MTQTLRGVNLGGWLVLEKWMTPSLFEGIMGDDEYSFMQSNQAKERIKKHRDTFITEHDFAWMADHGVEAIRLPVGYWIIDPDSPFEQGIEYVDWAFSMAEKYHLQLLLCLHGAEGSQNGHDHSGRRGKALWQKKKAFRDRTLVTLVTFHERYDSSPAYWGIQLLNEPKPGMFQFVLRQYYRDAARVISGKQHIVFHDAFSPRLLSGVLRRDTRAVIDLHLYHMTSFYAHFVSAKKYVKTVYARSFKLIQKVSKKQPVIIGEWSVILRGDTLKGIDEPTIQELMKQFGAAQLAAYNQAALAWFYWSYKTEQPGAWSYRWIVETSFLGDSLEIK